MQRLCWRQTLPFRAYLRLLLMITLLPFMLARAAEAQKGSVLAGGGEEISYLGMFHSPADVADLRTACQQLRDIFDASGKAKEFRPERPAVCDKVYTVVTGEDLSRRPEDDVPLLPARVATDSHRRVIVTDRGTRSVHVFDFVNRKYMRIDGRERDRLRSPYAVAVDTDDNVYVTDLERGAVAVFTRDGKFKKFIGEFEGEHEFEQPTAVALDQMSGRIYVADSSRNVVVILSREGKKIASIGRRGGGSGPGEFRRPSDLAFFRGELFVLDKANNRIQVLSREGKFKREIKADTGSSRGLAIDSRGRIYLLLDAGLIQVLGNSGGVLSHFGHYGVAPGEFIEPGGIFIDSLDRIFVAEAANHRVQIFQITAPGARGRTAAEQ